MRKFLASYSNELRKISARKKYYVFLVLQILAVLMSCFVTILIGKTTGSPMAASILIQGLSMSVLGFFIQIYIPLIVFMAACDLFPGEAHDGTDRAIIVRPVSRDKLYFSKVLAIFTVAVAYLVVLFVITTGAEAIVGHTLSGVIAAFASYLIDVIPMLVFVLFTCMIAQIGASSSLSLILCIIMYLALAISGIIIPALGSTLFTGYMMWHNLYIGIMIPFKAVITKFCLLAGYGLIFGCVGYYLYERKEI